MDIASMNRKPAYILSLRSSLRSGGQGGLMEKIGTLGSSPFLNSAAFPSTNTGISVNSCIHSGSM
jgi:hypothetical protein